MSDSGADNLQQTVRPSHPIYETDPKEVSFLGDLTSGHTLAVQSSITEGTRRQIFRRKSNACHCSVPNHIKLEASGGPELEDGIANRDRPAQWSAQQQQEWVTNVCNQYGQISSELFQLKDEV